MHETRQLYRYLKDYKINSEQAKENNQFYSDKGVLAAIGSGRRFNPWHQEMRPPPISRSDAVGSNFEERGGGVVKRSGLYM